MIRVNNYILVLNALVKWLVISALRDLSTDFNQIPSIICTVGFQIADKSGFQMVNFCMVPGFLFSE
jgi:hypothetical protein